MKIAVIIILLVILYCLASALYFMVGKRGGDEKKMVKALTWRIALSMFLFLAILFAYYMGWVHPHPTILIKGA